MELKDVFTKYTVAEIAQEMANQGYKVVVNDVFYSKDLTNATDKQLVLIEKITNELGVIFEGSTIAEASKFINDNLHFMNEMSDKQKEFVSKICATLEINFDGTTKKEAKEFISKHLCRYNAKTYDNNRSSWSGYSDGAFAREDYCGVSPYDIYDEFDMPSPF